MLTGTGLAGGGDFGAIVECSFGVGHEHWSGVLHIYCYWTWLSVVVHTWPASATPSHPRVSPKAGCQSIAETPPAPRLLATGRREKCSSKKRNCRDIAQRRRSEPNRSAYRCNETIAQSATATVPRLHYVKPDLDPSWDCLPPKWDRAKFYETHTFDNLHFQTMLLSKIWPHPLSLFQ